MALTIEQKPKYQLIAANGDIIFTVKDGNQVANRVKVKYIGEVYISNKTSQLNNNLVSKLKVSPNNAGVGIFDFGPIVRNFVSPDFTGGTVHNTNNINNSEYNTVQYSETTPHSIHQVDKFSTNRNSCRFLRIKFKVESAGNITDAVSDAGELQTSLDYVVYNGVLDETDILALDNNGNYGFNLDEAGFIMNDTNAKFLTNAPTTQYIKNNQYMTMPFFSQYDEDFVVGAGGTHPSVNTIQIKFYNSSNSVLSTVNRAVQAGNGGHAGNMGDSNTRMQFAGIGTGNITGAGSSIPATWSYYTIQAFANDSGGSSTAVSQLYYIYKQDDDCKGFDNIRLTWLNKFGGWDYYNFNKKSIKTFTAERTSYTQIKGVWNDTKFRYHGYKGGKKAFTNNITENITINTDFITESEAEWLEELFISTDVYIVHDKSTDNANEGYIRKYIEPVRLEASEHIRKTQTNDRLIQYTFSIVKSKNRQTQRV